jgi:hypothetical protein
MDFTNRNTQSINTNPSTAANPVTKKSRNGGGRWAQVGIVASVAAVAILIVAATLAISSSNKTTNESSFVDTSKLQAVFLNTGQVYFGNIKKLNTQYFVLTNIYYLQTSSTGTGSTASTSSAANNVSLVKLGCELHRPYDQMVINRTQVTFWENLESSGQVATAVKTFQQQNPQGQKCSDQSSAASTSSGNSAQSAGTSTTPAATTTKP